MNLIQKIGKKIIKSEIKILDILILKQKMKPKHETAYNFLQDM